MREGVRELGRAGGREGGKEGGREDAREDAREGREAWRGGRDAGYDNYGVRAYYMTRNRCIIAELYGIYTALIIVVGLPANAKHRRTWKSGTYEMF